MKLIARKTLFLPRQNRLEHPISVTQKGATQKGATQKDVTQKGVAQKGVAQKGVAQKGVAQNKCTWSKNLGWGCVILTLTLTGCDKVKQIASQRNASVTASTTASTAAANPSINPTSQPTPVVYPISEWQQQTLANKVSIHDIDAVTLLLGQPITIDTQSLDYRSNVASKYSFAKTGEPYFDLLDSPMYIEVQWYYASAYDNASVKNISIKHAKTAFHLTQNWFGQDGSDIVAHMVQGQPIKNASYHGILVELARCDNYHCDLVVRKPTVTAKTAKKSG
ncbi:hypothetical protein I6I87_09775 [Moraxella osloensis]|nr:hypothetical protein [Moraxella osloensis]QQU06345.1 hypothetical protein I6I87_09775 [Moraxella osloensis]